MARRATPRADPSTVDAAIDALSVGELREIVRKLLSRLDRRTYSQTVHELIDRAARGRAGRTAGSPPARRVEEIVAAAEAARRVGWADPAAVDDHLCEGSIAFLAKDYGSAVRIFRAWLVPLGEAEIDLGQDEMVDEVLGVAVDACAAQYVVATYMTSEPGQRAEAVWDAIDDVDGIGCFREPLREMERVAVEPLPALDEFLPQWRALVEPNATASHQTDWESREDGWLREVVHRIEGAEGLGRLARSTRRTSDLRAWCEALVESGDWAAALSAYEEAAEIVKERPLSRSEFLDGAALAAQELGREDLPARLERAWCEAPTMPRLLRWLGAAGDRAVLRQRAARALDLCSETAHCQQAFLHLVLGEHESAARLLAAAPGLGWSESEHPGHLMFSLFENLLGAASEPSSSLPGGVDGEALEREETENGPHLPAPEPAEILAAAGIDRITDAGVFKAVLEAMREAAERRVAGVAGKTRRRYYGHAAHLVAVCESIDPAPAWVAALRSQHRRFPALQREFARHLGLP